MGGVRFAKYHGLGNDFVVIDAEAESALPVASAPRLCDRRHGVGADGVLLILPARSAGAAARMKVINADGSVPETCGNGLRCAALHVARHRGLQAAELILETDAGSKPCFVERTADGEGVVTVDMGLIRVTDDVVLEVLGLPIPLVLADAGNPHAIYLGDMPRSEVERLGPIIATHPRFPRGTNVAFVNVQGETSADAVVWERGVGITLACGSGACATAAVLTRKGLAPTNRDVAIRLLGGTLDVRIQSGGHAIMRGPASLVFTGELAE